ncbi:MAG TPA: DUF402 domain-containing protein [Chloroflexia bacterium]|nr:DUF402 domain-containing protein [Chloroflexia bacterium]
MYTPNTESRAWLPLSGLRRIQVLALGYNRKPHKRWSGWILEDEPDRIVTYRPPQATVLVNEHDAWVAQAPAVCLFWPGRYYNLSYLLDAESQLQGYYVDVTTPPVRRPGYLEYVDLNLGLIIGPDLEYAVDSEHGAAVYPADLRGQAREALQAVISLVEARDPLLGPPRYWLDILDNSDRNTLDEVAAMLR